MLELTQLEGRLFVLLLAKRGAEVNGDIAGILEMLNAIEKVEEAMLEEDDEIIKAFGAKIDALHVAVGCSEDCKHKRTLSKGEHRGKAKGS